MTFDDPPDQIDLHPSIRQDGDHPAGQPCPVIWQIDNLAGPENGQLAASNRAVRKSYCSTLKRRAR